MCQIQSGRLHQSPIWWVRALYTARSRLSRRYKLAEVLLGQASFLNSVATMYSPSALELDWSRDPANAHNWTFPKKIYNTAVPSLLCFLMLVHLILLILCILTNTVRSGSQSTLLPMPKSRNISRLPRPCPFCPSVYTSMASHLAL